MPTPNPVLKQLGFSDTDRVAIIHTDDIGMCHASLEAFKHLWEFGTITSAAVMVPCPWFPATAALCRANPEIDMGVHAVLNSEWDNYRWGPVSTTDRATGLMDEEGYFHHWHKGVYENAKPEAVEVEVNAQVECAIAAGIQPTHIDSHMGTIMSPNYIQSYLQAGATRLIPNMVPRASAQGFWMMEGRPEVIAQYTPILQQLEAQGFIMVDAIVSMPLDEPDDNIGYAKRLFESLPAGITHYILHPSVDTPELRAIAPDWQSRVANYNAFMSQELKDYIKNSGVQVIGYRALRDLLRQ
jgi:hypothetical protein